MRIKQYKLPNRTDYNHEDVAILKTLDTFTPFSQQNFVKNKQKD